MSRTRPCAAGADRHAPQAGLYWYVIVDDGRDLGTVWIDLPPAAAEAVLGVFLGGPAALGHGIGTAAVELAVSEFRAAHPHLPVVLRVRRSNARAIACYRRAGFALTGSGTSRSPRASGSLITAWSFRRHDLAHADQQSPVEQVHQPDAPTRRVCSAAPRAGYAHHVSATEDVAMGEEP